jgi:hypothetical protein
MEVDAIVQTFGPDDFNLRAQSSASKRAEFKKQWDSVHAASCEARIQESLNFESQAFEKQPMSDEALNAFISNLSSRVQLRHQSEPEEEKGVSCGLIQNAFDVHFWPERLVPLPTSIPAPVAIERMYENFYWPSEKSSDVAEPLPNGSTTPVPPARRSIWDVVDTSHPTIVTEEDVDTLLANFVDVVNPWTGAKSDALYGFNLTKNPIYDCTVIFKIIVHVLKKYNILVHDIEENLNCYFGRSKSACLGDDTVWKFYCSKNNWQFMITWTDDCDCIPGILKLRDLRNVVDLKYDRSYFCDLFAQNTGAKVVKQCMKLLDCTDYHSYRKQHLPKYKQFERCCETMQGSDFSVSEYHPAIRSGIKFFLPRAKIQETVPGHQFQSMELDYDKRCYLISAKDNGGRHGHCFVTVDFGKNTAKISNPFSTHVLNEAQCDADLIKRIEANIAWKFDTISESDGYMQILDLIPSLMTQDAVDENSNLLLSPIPVETKGATGLFPQANNGTFTEMVFGGMFRAKKPAIEPFRFYKVARAFDGILFRPTQSKFSEVESFEDNKKHVQYFILLWNEYGKSLQKVQSQRANYPDKNVHDLIDYFTHAGFTPQWSEFINDPSKHTILRMHTFDQGDYSSNKDSFKPFAVTLALFSRKLYPYLSEKIVGYRQDHKLQSLECPYDAYSFVFEHLKTGLYRLTVVSEIKMVHEISHDFHSKSNELSSANAPSSHVEHVFEGPFSIVFDTFMNTMVYINQGITSSPQIQEQ